MRSPCWTVIDRPALPFRQAGVWIMTADADRRGAYESWLCDQTRRHFFSRCGVGLGGMALGSLLGEHLGLGAEAHEAAAHRRPMDTRSAAPGVRATNPLAVRPGHFPPRAKSVIYLF